MRSEQDHQGYMTFFDLKKKIKIFFLLGNWIDSIWSSEFITKNKDLYGIQVENDFNG